jgi:hypothetical protein
MARSGPWLLFSSMVATVAGLAVVLGHQVWSSCVLPVVVTLTGRIRLGTRDRCGVALLVCAESVATMDLIHPASIGSRKRSTERGASSEVGILLQH